MLLNDTVVTSEEIKNEPLDDEAKEANMESKTGQPLEMRALFY